MQGQYRGNAGAIQGQCKGGKVPIFEATPLEAQTADLFELDEKRIEERGEIPADDINGNKIVSLSSGVSLCVAGFS